MKKTSLFLVAVMLAFPLAFASSSVKTKLSVPSAERVSFKIKGTGSKNITVSIGIGYQPGSGACCTGVSPFTTVSFVGNVGDVVYDGMRRVIAKISKDTNGTTLDLAQYY